MIRYVVRRILQMIPTVFGVILITFLLFNVAGGDPGLVRLGQHATAKSLEEYDEQRGLNRPLILGWWGTTRVFRKATFDANAGAWTAVRGAAFTNQSRGAVVLEPGHDYDVPLHSEAFKSGATYRLEILYRFAGEDGKGVLSATDGESVVSRAVLGADDSWRRVRLVFETGKDVSKVGCRLSVDNAPLHIRAMEMRRKAGNLADSQFVFFLKQIASFDFGKSDASNQKISSMILEGLLPSLSLTVPIFVIGLFVSIAISLVCAYFRNSFIDRFLVVISVLMMSIPYLVWIIGGQYFFAYRLGWFPMWGYESMRYLFLPVIVGIVSGLGGSIRFYRTIMLDEMYKDYVRTALAKGVSRPGVLFRHVLKNAMIPILTSVVMTIPFLYTGSLLLESFFGIPGLGRMTFNAINNSDFDVIKAVVFMGAVIYVIANLVTDICYAMVDPRVRLK